MTGGRGGLRTDKGGRGKSGRRGASRAAPVRVLILDDVPADAELMERELARSGLPLATRRVTDAASFQAALREFAPDVVLSDYSLPQFSGMAALAITQELAPDTPLIIVTGTLDEETAADCIKAGATDYVLKDRLARLGPALRGALELRRSREAARHAEEALRQSEERYRAFIAQSTEGIWRFELDEPLAVDRPLEEQIEHFYAHGYLAECNDAMARMYGFASAAELVGARLPALLVRDDPRNVEFLRAFVQSRYRLADVESHERDRAGRVRFFLNNLVGIVEDGQLRRAWGTQRDITDSRQLEEQLRQSQKIEAVGRLAGGVAHDFNNLITAILGYTDLVLEDLPRDDAHRADIDEIRMAAERAAGLTRQLLAFSRKQVLQPRVVDLNAIVSGMDRMLRRLIGDDVELRTQPAPHLGLIHADPGQIEQVILNLVVNARDAMPRGGKLTIETANAELDETFTARHAIVQPGPYVMLAISDTGTGMDEHTQAHLFEPFFTTKEVGKGTGLGLSTVYGIVKQSGGYVWVYSELGQGATFKIYLPHVEAAPEAAAPPAPTPAAASLAGTETILVVEDADPVRALATRVLRAHGYTVLEARNGVDAERACRDHRGSIHLLLTDVVMPEVNGHELAGRLERLRRGLKVLYMSGYTDEAIIHHGMLAPGVNYLQKPFTPEALLRRLREVLEMR